MERTQKIELVDALRETFANASLVILTEFKGATVAEMDAVRRKAEGAGASYAVVKNTLCRRAVEGTPFEPLAGHFKGNVGVLFAGEDPIAAAKAYREIKKANEKIAPKAAVFEGALLDAKGVDSVADLPSREELLSTLLATIQEGPRQVLGILQAPARDLLYLLNNFANKLEEGGA